MRFPLGEGAMSAGEISLGGAPLSGNGKCRPAPPHAPTGPRPYDGDCHQPPDLAGKCHCRERSPLTGLVVGGSGRGHAEDGDLVAIEHKFDRLIGRQPSVAVVERRVVNDDPVDAELGCGGTKLGAVVDEGIDRPVDRLLPPIATLSDIC